MENKTCCFLGHRTIEETEKLRWELCECIERLIIEKQVDTFLFGSKSRFNGLCLELVTEIRQKYPHIRRIYVRAEFSDINDDYKAYLLERYEDTYYPEALLNAGKAVYVKRNYEMIDRSNYCIIYYEPLKSHVIRKSGTKIALDYAIKQKKQIFCFSGINTC